MRGALSAFPEVIGMSKEVGGAKQKFLHTDLVVTGATLRITPHNHNEAFNRGQDKHPKVTRLVPPFKYPLTADQELYQYVA